MPQANPTEYFHAYRFHVTIDGEPLSVAGARVENRGAERAITISCALQRDNNGLPVSKLSIYEAGEHTVVISVVPDKPLIPRGFYRRAKPEPIEWRSSRARAESFSPCKFDASNDGYVFEQIVLVGERG